MSNRAVSQETGTDMVKTRNGKTNNQESASAPLTKWETPGGAVKSATPREVAHDKDASHPAPRGGVPFKSAWSESRESTFPPVPSPFAPPPTLWAGPAENASPQRSFSTIPKRPDTDPKDSSPEEAGSPDGPITTGHRAILSPTCEPAAPPAHHPTHRAPDDEDEPRRGTLTDSTPAYVSASTPRSPSQSPGKNGGSGGTDPGEAAGPARSPDADAGGTKPDQPPSPGEPPGRTAEAAADPAASGDSPETTGDDDRLVNATTYSQIRSISRGHWGVAFLSSLGILLSTGALTVIASSIQQFTDFGGLPNSAALLGQITRTWSQFATDGFAQLLAIMLPVLLALLTALYIAFSIQGNHSPDRDDRVTNEQVALQQTREGIILLLAGLTGITITLTIPWLTERAPLLLLLPAGGVITCGFLIAIRTRSLENERMRLARSKQQEAVLARTNAKATEARLRKRGRNRERQESSRDRKERKRDRNRASRQTLLRHKRKQLLTRHFMVATLLAALSPIPLTWHLAHNVTTVWEVLLFHLATVVWLRFFWGYTFTLMRKDVLAEAMKPGNNRLARLGAWLVRTAFELLTTVIALGVIVLILARLPGLDELPLIVVCTICWHLVLVVIRWLYQQCSRTGRGIRQLDRRLKLVRLRREVAELRAGIS